MHKGLLVTDLDGTLTAASGKIPPDAIQQLEILGRENIARVIATGRNLYSAMRAVSRETPFDYLIFSGGAGVMDWRSRSVLESSELKKVDVERIARFLISEQRDFMVQAPIPENHRFHYHQSSSDNSDFLRRRELYVEFVSPLEVERCPKASQIIIVEPEARGVQTFLAIRTHFSDLAVVRTTSPLDQRSVWIEILPNGVSKSSAAEGIRKKLNVSLESTLAIGNDYNDIDLLEWSKTSFVVEGSPSELIEHFPVVKDFSTAVEKWLNLVLA